MALTLAKGLRFLYLRVLTLMNMDYLPTPTESPCSSLFFPATEENREAQRTRLASPLPFSVRDSRDVKHDLLTRGDPCDHLLVTQVRYYQRVIAPLHEFMVVEFKDIRRTDAEVKSYVLLERWGSDFRPPNKSLKKIERHELDANQIRSTDGLNGSASHSRSSSSTSLTASLHSSSNSSSVANDRFIIFLRRKMADVDKLEPSGYTLLATLTRPSSSSFNMAKLAVLTTCVTEDIPIYNTLDSQCFYFGRVIWEVMRMEMGVPSDEAVAPNDPGDMKVDPLHWASHYVKGKMADKVKSSHGAPAIRAKFNDAWLLFDKEVRERVVRLQKPILDLEASVLEERQRRQQLEVESEARILEERQRSEARILEEQQRSEALFLKVQRLEAQIANASASQT
ncbi:hypothetical protein BDP27DRAFT_1334763 [Rhodocollybia butyracea]|uniref:Uncharacterized protein n=1 Tax=Rhodocollybia butyracea TaxID=206335 RepID=A0A9P5U2N4_9AGAR|nr:hypothetical protein BDP27DRAFT_1334763 [Rhodocollybia butyracea]